MTNRLRVLVAMLPLVLLMGIAVTHYHDGSKTLEDHPPSTSVPEFAGASSGRAAGFDLLKQPPPTTTTTAPPPPPTTTTTSPPSTEAPPPPPPKPSSPSGSWGDPNDPATWDRLAQCESGGDWHINTGNGYYGGIQFSLSSWQAVGGTGYPHEHSREEQIRRGQMLWQQGGWNHWPACSSHLGYR